MFARGLPVALSGEGRISVISCIRIGAFMQLERGQIYAESVSTTPTCSQYQKDLLTKICWYDKQSLQK